MMMMTMKGIQCANHNQGETILWPQPFSIPHQMLVGRGATPFT